MLIVVLLIHKNKLTFTVRYRVLFIINRAFPVSIITVFFSTYDKNRNVRLINPIHGREITVLTIFQCYENKVDWSEQKIHRLREPLDGAFPLLFGTIKSGCNNRRINSVIIIQYGSRGISTKAMSEQVNRPARKCFIVVTVR